jgi:ribosomal protein S24E
MDEFTEQQQELLKRPTIVITPAFNGESVIEVYDQKENLVGRCNVSDNNMVITAIRSALTDNDGPEGFEVN